VFLMFRLPTPVLICVAALLLVACGDSAPPPPPPAPTPNAAIEKAKAVEGQVMEGKARLDEELDKQDQQD
jgi:hypothetical protein